MKKRGWLRWTAPLAVLGVALVAPTITATVAADPGTSLPPRSAEQLLVDVQTATVPGLSGTIIQRSELGLPSLPGLTDTGSGFESFLSGSHTAKVWLAEPNKARLALLEQLGETDLIVNGSEAWHWRSEDKLVDHWKFSDKGLDRAEQKEPEDYSPQAAAKAVLDALEENSTVSTGGTSRVAGRPAYDLTIRPRSADSLIDQVRISIDGETFVPVGLAVYAVGQTTAAFDLTFSKINFEVPAAETFEFVPPPGAKVTEREGAPTKDSPDVDKRHDSQPAKGSDHPRVVGEGWTAVVVTNLSSDLPTTHEPRKRHGENPADLSSILESLPKVSGSWGSGRLLQSALVSVLITDDGLVLAGAVRPEVLYDVAGQ